MAGHSGVAAARTAFASRDFRLFCAAETVSLIGDQFYLLALPWLVLQTTGSALAVGTVTAVAAIPRALFMLFAGALTDRISPRMLMLASSLVRMALAASLAGLALGGMVELWVLYAFALTFGVGDAFYFPARGTLVPRLLPARALLAGNAAIEAGNQLAMFAGPVLAGSLIAALHRSHDASASGDPRGLGVAFAVDALTFVVSAIMLWCMSSGGSAPGHELAQAGKGLWRSVLEGLGAVKSDPFMRSTFLLLGAGNFLITGPLYVGLPVLAATRFTGGAGDLGLVLSLFGAGSLAGIVLAAIGRRPAERPPVLAMALCPIALGAGLVVLGTVRTAGSAAIVTAAMGFAQGYLVVQFMTFVQRRTAPHVLGRVISLLTFLVVGLSPLSSGFAGALLELSVSWLLIGAGSGLIVVVGAAFLTPGVRPSLRLPTRVLPE